MSETEIIVVGNRFVDFARANNAVVLDELGAMASGAADALGDARLIFGQGICREVVQPILDKLPPRVDVSDAARLDSRASGRLSHKRLDCNTLIGKPESLGGDRYRLPLLIDERCELMSDHQTGQHIQGMLLVEAFRQSMLAIFETSHPLPDQIKAYAVINKLSVSFVNFMFPLPAHVECTLTALDCNGRRSRLEAEMVAVQGDTRCATCDTVFTFYPNHVIAEREGELASAAVASVGNLAAASAEGAAPAVAAGGTR